MFLWVFLHSRNLTLHKCFIDDIFLTWDGSRETLVDFSMTLILRMKRITITYQISDSKICVFSKILLIIRCNTLPFRNRLLFLPIFREINYSNRHFSKPNRLSTQRKVVFKSTFNCNHVRIKTVILEYLPHLSCIVSYKSTNTLAHLWKKIFLGAHGFSRKIAHCTFSTLHTILIISCKLCFCACFLQFATFWNVICTITISFNIIVLTLSRSNSLTKSMLRRNP